MVSVKYRDEKSVCGHSLSVLKSAVQKYIRPGNVEKVEWCVGQLSSFILAPEENSRVQSVFTNILHRLMIITLEDCDSLNVNVGKQTLFNFVDQFICQIKINVKEKNLDSLFNNMAIFSVMLANSPKSRDAFADKS